jgi:glycosyltransferase involved in cell wall biosynthesis
VSEAPLPPLPPGAVILQVLPALNVAGGVERGTLEMAEAIVAAGGRALVASSGGPRVAELEALGARHIIMPLDTKTPWGIWRNARALARLIAAENVALVHARSRAPAIAALWAARRQGVKCVTTYHGAYSENFPGKRFYNSVMARGDRVIAISHFVAGLIRARHGVPPERLRIIPRGVDPRRFDPARVPPEAPAALRARLGIPEDMTVLLLPGRLRAWKGGGVALAALAQLDRPGVGLLFVGGGAEERFGRHLAAEAARLGLGGRVWFAGAIADMPAAFALAEVVLAPSLAPEAFGRTVIEAQAMGRVVIASAHGGAAETIEDGRTGFLVPPGEAEALAAAIARVLDLGPEGRAALGQAARKAVLARYTTRALQAATLAVYRELLIPDQGRLSEAEAAGGGGMDARGES